MAEGSIVGRKEGPVGRLIFDNQKKRNAVSLDMARRVPEVLADFDADPTIRVIAVSGAGTESFVSGMDISEFESRRSNAEQAAEYAAISGAMYRAVRSAEKPTVALIRGFCVGGGVAIACACDLRMCSDDSHFAVPAARLGIAYREDYTRWLVEAVGPAYAKEILISARRYTAVEAGAMHLVHAAIPAADFDAAAAKYLARIADNAPLSMKAGKFAVNAIAGGWDGASRERAARLAEACIESEDYTEGRRAFVEKRKPNFTGR
jgi:enoyl-CoA hydratase/carnithine racemase